MSPTLANSLGYVFFFVFGALSIVGAIATVASPNPIRGAMGLLLMIVSIAALFLPLHAQFLAAIQLIVYAGAVVVLFLFVIMLLGSNAQSVPDERGRLTRYAAAGLFAGLGAGAGVLLFKAMPVPVKPVNEPVDFGSIDAFGKVIFQDALVPFELSSALLIVAIVGAVAIARGTHKEDAIPQGKLEGNKLAKRTLKKVESV
jgi:NADH-quinone oxidoreductase subunit J